MRLLLTISAIYNICKRIDMEKGGFLNNSEENKQTETSNCVPTILVYWSAETKP
jgi:hypothetical protein